LQSYIEWGISPTSAKCGGVAIGSSLLSLPHNRPPYLEKKFGGLENHP